MYHRQKTAVCVLTEQGKIIKEMEVTSEPDSQIAILQGLDGIVEAVGLEAGPLSQ
jgi:transposase